MKSTGEMQFQTKQFKTDLTPLTTLVFFAFFFIFLQKRQHIILTGWHNCNWSLVI